MKPAELEVVVVVGRGWRQPYAWLLEKQLRVLSEAPRGVGVAYVVSMDKPGAERLARSLEDLAVRLGVRHRIIKVRGDRGASHSRNLAIASSKAGILAFIDDDVVPSPQWAAGIMEAFKPGWVDGVFGAVEPLFPRDTLCSRVPRSLYWLFSCTPSYAPPRRTLFYRGFGANMAFRRKALLEVGGFRTDLGVGARHSKGLLGEEAELAARLCVKGYRVIYAPGAKAYHYVDPSRCTPIYAATRAYRVGRTNRLVDRIYRQARSSGCGSSSSINVGVRAVARGLLEAAGRGLGALSYLLLASIGFLAGYAAG